MPCSPTLGWLTSSLDGTAVPPIRHKGCGRPIQTFTRYKTVYLEGAFTAIHSDDTNAVLITPIAGICAPRNRAFLPRP
jgi:hypothetical protein